MVESNRIEKTTSMELGDLLLNKKPPTSLTESGTAHVIPPRVRNWNSRSSIDIQEELERKEREREEQTMRARHEGGRIRFLLAELVHIKNSIISNRDKANQIEKQIKINVKKSPAGIFGRVVGLHYDHIDFREEDKYLADPRWTMMTARKGYYISKEKQQELNHKIMLLLQRYSRGTEDADEAAKAIEIMKEYMKLLNEIIYNQQDLKAKQEEINQFVANSSASAPEILDRCLNEIKYRENRYVITGGWGNNV